MPTSLYTCSLKRRGSRVSLKSAEGALHTSLEQRPRKKGDQTGSRAVSPIHPDHEGTRAAISFRVQREEPWNRYTKYCMWDYESGFQPSKRSKYVTWVAPEPGALPQAGMGPRLRRSIPMSTQFGSCPDGDLADPRLLLPGACVCRGNAVRCMACRRFGAALPPLYAQRLMSLCIIDCQRNPLE